MSKAKIRVLNRAELARTGRAATALDIIEAGLNAVLPETLMRRALAYRPKDDMLRVWNAKYALDGGRLFVIGAGKAAGRMAAALENLVGAERITAGTIVTNNASPGTGKMEVLSGGHPFPDVRSVAAVKRMQSLKDDYEIVAGDTVICLISGGASALMAQPVPGISLDDKREMTAALIGSGADITAMNIIRKHISNVKGGRLGRYFAPARIISLVISDVVGDDLSVIASGPTVPDPTTFADALAVIDRYGLTERMPPGVIRYLNDGNAGRAPETPKVLDNCHNHIIGNVKTALDAMAGAAERAGYCPLIIDDRLDGDASRKAETIAGSIIAGSYGQHDALLAGGETTVELPEHHGKGGRNQHFAAVTMNAMAGFTAGGWLAVSVGSDGRDFVDGVAGAMVSGDTAERASGEGLIIEEYIQRRDSNSLFRALGGSLVVTGDTGTNVGDLVLYLLK